MAMKRGKHTSLHSSIRSEIFWLENLPIVRRVLLGPAESCRHKFKVGKLKYMGYKNSAVKFNLYTGKGIMKITVMTDKKDELLKLVEERTT